MCCIDIMDVLVLLYIITAAEMVLVATLHGIETGQQKLNRELNPGC